MLGQWALEYYGQRVCATLSPRETRQYSLFLYIWFQSLVSEYPGELCFEQILMRDYILHTVQVMQNDSGQTGMCFKEKGN